jgi:hypothetical protein
VADLEGSAESWDREVARGDSVPDSGGIKAYQVEAVNGGDPA